MNNLTLKEQSLSFAGGGGEGGGERGDKERGRVGGFFSFSTPSGPMRIKIVGQYIYLIRPFCVWHR